MIYFISITAVITIAAAITLTHAHVRRMPDGGKAARTVETAAMWTVSALMLTAAWAAPLITAVDETPPQLNHLQERAGELRRQVRALDAASKKAAQQPFYHDVRKETIREITDEVYEEYADYHYIAVYSGDEETVRQILQWDIEQSGTITTTLRHNRLAAMMPGSYAECVAHLVSPEFDSRSDGQYVEWARRTAQQQESRCPAGEGEETRLTVFRVHGETYPQEIAKMGAAFVAMFYTFGILMMSAIHEDRVKWAARRAEKENDDGRPGARPPQTARDAAA